MRVTKQIIVFVNAYSTSTYMPLHFLCHGYQCIHIATPLKLAEKMQVHTRIQKEHFLETIEMCDESSEELYRVVDFLRNYSIKAILPGSESSVMMTDRIAQFFNVPKNESATSLQRRHKYYMIAALARFGLKTQQQCTVTSLNDLLAWYKKMKFKKVVLKPPMSTSSDNVYICQTTDELRDSFPMIYQQSNVYGFENQEVIAQEFIDGEEYVVNSVSLAGEHVITECWKGVTRYQDGLLVHDYAELVSHHDTVETYAKQVLTILGVQNGPAHTEIRVNKNGCYLIECGARLAGAIDPSAMIEAKGYSQLSLFAESILHPTNFRERIGKAKDSKTNCVRYVYLTPRLSGIIQQAPDLSHFLEIDSLHSIYFSLSKGDKINIAQEVSDIHGYAYLISESKEKLELDYATFKNIENEFYLSLIHPLNTPILLDFVPEPTLHSRFN